MVTLSWCKDNNTLYNILDDCSEMFITWSTEEATPGSTVEYGEISMDHQVNGSYIWFNDSASQFIHKTRLTSLKPKTKYSKFIDITAKS